MPKSRTANDVMIITLESLVDVNVWHKLLVYNFIQSIVVYNST